MTTIPSGGALGRIGALMLRHLYLIRGSWPRTLELAYWPALQILIWGFMTQFLATNSSVVAQAFGVLLAGVLLWEVTVRGNFGVSITFLEEVWSRNLGHLFVSPMRPVEYIVSLLAMALIRTLIGVVPAVIIAWLLYDYSIFTMGLPLLAFFSLLMVMGWTVGLITSAVILRHGLGAESFAWLAVFLIAPISGIYYPLATLPDWLQWVAQAFPPAHVFEGMRTALFEGRFDWARFAAAAALDAFYLLIALAVFLGAIRYARDNARLLQNGE